MSALCQKQTFDCYSINSSALPDRGNDTLQRRHYAFQVTETYDTIIRTGRRAAIGVVSRDKSDRLRLKEGGDNKGKRRFDRCLALRSFHLCPGIARWALRSGKR